MATKKTGARSTKKDHKDAPSVPEQDAAQPATEESASQQPAAEDSVDNGAPEEIVPEEIAPEEIAPEEITEADLPEEDQWVFLMDPAWQPTDENEEPPPEAVVGGWFVEADGTTGRFRPNPGYEPSEPDLPTDPVDAALQLVVRGEADGDELLETTKDVIFGVALDEEGVAIVAPAPDDVPSVLVTTAPRHRERVEADDWVEVTVEELAAALPEEGVDVLLNPGAPASMRIIADALREFLADGADETSTDSDEALSADGLQTQSAGPDGDDTNDSSGSAETENAEVSERTAAATN